MDDQKDYRLTCIKCGRNRNIEMIAYRNKQESVTGFIFVCEHCRNQIADKDIKIVLKK
ncbi:hypothetical protein LCGC14_2002310 [marine sediment metagenome]|uniref:Uncharacterized protein n=1 Tax=marine sediment metagenome TaxID=412755 RepID=A0A0F9FQH9_9ZZZZ